MTQGARGFTLAEIMIAVGVMGILAIGIPALIQSGLASMEMQRNASTDARELGRFLDEFARDAAGSGTAVATPGLVVLPQSGGDVRYRFASGEVWRDMRTGGVGPWRARPARAIATFGAADSLTFAAAPRTVQAVRIGPSGAQTMTVWLRRAP